MHCPYGYSFGSVPPLPERKGLAIDRLKQVTLLHAFYRSVFDQDSQRTWTRSFWQNVAPSPWVDSIILLAGSTSTGAKRPPAATNSERPAKRPKTSTGILWRQEPVQKDRSAPSVLIGSNNKFRHKGPKRFACFYWKTDPESHEACCGENFMNLRSLRRPDRHMKKHFERGDIKREDLQQLFRGIVVPENSPDRELLEKLWKLMFTKLFPVYRAVEDRLDPYAFGEILPNDSELAKSLKLRHYYTVASPDEQVLGPETGHRVLYTPPAHVSVHRHTPRATADGLLPPNGSIGIVDNSGRQGEQFQRVGMDSLPNEKLAVSLPICRIQNCFNSVREGYENMLKGIRNEAPNVDNQNIRRVISTNLKALEWLRSKTGSEEGVKEILTTYEQNSPSPLPPPSPSCDDNCLLQKIVNDECNVKEAALKSAKTFEDVSFDSTQKYYAESLNALKSFSSCFMSIPSLHGLLPCFVDHLSRNHPEHISAAPPLTRGTSESEYEMSNKSHPSPFVRDPSVSFGIDPTLLEAESPLGKGKPKGGVLPFLGGQMEEERRGYGTSIPSPAIYPDLDDEPWMLTIV